MEDLSWADVSSSALACSQRPLLPPFSLPRSNNKPTRVTANSTSPLHSQFHLNLVCLSEERSRTTRTLPGDWHRESQREKEKQQRRIVFFFLVLFSIQPRPILALSVALWLMIALLWPLFSAFRLWMYYRNDVVWSTSADHRGSNQLTLRWAIETVRRAATLACQFWLFEQLEQFWWITSNRKSL